METNVPIDNKIPLTKQRLWTANFILICLSNFTVYIALHSQHPTLPIYIEKLGGSKDTVGLALAFLTIAAVIIRPVTGWALDNFGRKKILIVGLIIFLIPCLIYTSMIGIIPLLIFRLIQGFGWGICNTSQATVASDLIPRQRLGEGLGFYGTTISLSLAIAPAIGLWLVDNFSFQSLFITNSILTLASIILALSIKYPQTEPPATKSKLVFLEKLALRPSVIILLIATTYSSTLSFLALFIRQKEMVTAGLFFTAMAITTLASRPFAGKLIDKKGRRGYDFVVITGVISLIISMIILAQTTSTLHLLLSGILFGIGFGSLQPTMLALCISSVPAVRRGAANATYWTAFDIGVASGSIFWGIIANSYGYATMFNLTIIPVLLALIVYSINRKPIPA